MYTACHNWLKMKIQEAGEDKQTKRIVGPRRFWII